MTRTNVHTCTIAALAFTVGYAVHAQSFDLKLGQWEFTMTGLSLDTSQLSPQMRAALEAGAKKPSSYKGCDGRECERPKPRQAGRWRRDV
jgi:hypothetical protein